MNRIRRAAVRAVLPVTVFVAVAAFHFVWLGVFPEKVATEAACGDDCAACEALTATGWLDRYVAGQSYWLGYSCGPQRCPGRRNRERIAGGIRLLSAPQTASYHDVWPVTLCPGWGARWVSLLGTSLVGFIYPIRDFSRNAIVMVSQFEHLVTAENSLEPHGCPARRVGTPVARAHGRTGRVGPAADRDR